MLPEYDLKSKKGVRGKYAKAMQEGYSVRVFNEDGTVTIRDSVLLDPDVKAYFPDSESVNRTLRSLINLIPENKASQSPNIVAGMTTSKQAGATTCRYDDQF